MVLHKDNILGDPLKVVPEEVVVALFKIMVFNEGAV